MRFPLTLGGAALLAAALLAANLDANLAGAGQAMAADSIITGNCEGGVVPLAIVAPEESLVAGCQGRYLLKNGAGKGERGSFGFVDLPDCPLSSCPSKQGGREKLECEIAYGNLCCLGSQLVGTELKLLQGDRSGPFLKGILTRWQGDIDYTTNRCYWDYAGNGRRVIRVLIVDPVPGAGPGRVRVAGYADFFLRNLPMRPVDDLEGEFISERRN